MPLTHAASLVLAWIEHAGQVIIYLAPSKGLLLFEALSVHMFHPKAHKHARVTRLHMRAQYNKFIMIDRIFFAAQNQMPNPYGLLASEYDVVTDTFRNLSAGIISNSWCSAVRPPPVSGSQPCSCPIRRTPGPSCTRPPSTEAELGACQHIGISNMFLERAHSGVHNMKCCALEGLAVLLPPWLQQC